MGPLLLLLLLTLSLAAQQQPRTWTVANKATAVAFVTLTIVDVIQTHQILAVGGGEANPLIGAHPTHARLNVLAGLGLVGSLGIAQALPNPWRQLWLSGLGALESYCVTSNARLLARIPF